MENFNDTPSEKDNHIDFELLNWTTLGNPELRSEIIALYIEQTERQLSVIEDAIRSKDSAKLYQAAHKALGGSATCGMKTILSPLEELERLGKEHRFDDAEYLLSKARAIFAEICRQCAELEEQPASTQMNIPAENPRSSMPSD